MSLPYSQYNRTMKLKPHSLEICRELFRKGITTNIETKRVWAYQWGEFNAYQQWDLVLKKPQCKEFPFTETYFPAPTSEELEVFQCGEGI